MASKRVEFRTVDGVKLRGDLFLAPPQPNGTPIIIMTQGLTLLKEHFIPNWGRRFLAAGYSVLIYDHRGWGSSERSPANLVSPQQQAEDYHDAVLFVRSLPEIDSSRIAIWGIGHSGGAAMIAAGDDPHIKAVILVMPFISGTWDSTNWPAGIMERVHAERERLTRDDLGGAEPEYVQAWDASDAEAAAEERGDTIIHGQVPWSFARGARQLSDEAGTPWENRLALQSLYHIAKAEPQDHIHKISPRPMLYLAASVDPLSGPLEAQRAAFERAKEPKQFVQLQSDHLANYNSTLFDVNVQAQIEFLQLNL
ncbi:Alpha/Beta hydrolase protein [Xylariales sp. PMI_506]|nr:Alpha/Beta hydrolase protein [Xylariales sp. PMI_506]